MKYGMPTLIECKDVYECLNVAQKYDLDFLELNMSFPQYQPQSLNIESLKRYKRETGMFFTVHADEMINPFDFNSKVSECYFDVMRDTIRFALALDIPIINMHLLKGVYVTLPDKVLLLNDVYRDKYLERVRRFIELCEKEIGAAPLKIAIENVDSNAFTEGQLAALELFMNSPVFALTLDTGHEYCLDYADSFVFDKYSDKLAHMHLHDAIGKSAHLPLGTGAVAVIDKISKLADASTCLIEVKTVAGLAESIDYIKNIGYWKV